MCADGIFIQIFGIAKSLSGIAEIRPRMTIYSLISSRAEHGALISA